MAVSVRTFNESNTKFLPWKKMTTVAEAIFADEKIYDASLNIIVLTDDRIQEINRRYLEHDYATDVISFNIEDEPLEGEIYISADTARKQAEEYRVSLSNEMVRLTAHGTLHVCGHDDATDEMRQAMHILENKYLGLYWKES